MDAARPATPLEAAPAPATADGPRAGVGEAQSLGKGLGPAPMPSSSIPAAAANGSASSSSTAVLPASTSPGTKHADAWGATASQAQGPTQQGTQQPTGQEVLKQGEPTAGSGQPPESGSLSEKSTPAAGPSAAAPAAASSNPAPPSATSAAPAAGPSTPAPAPTPAAGPGKAGPKLPPRKVPNHSTGASTSSSATGTASASAPGKAATTGQAVGSSPSPSKPAEASSSSKPTKSAFMPSLPPRSAAPTCGPVLDPEEPEAIQKLRKDIHAIRVSLIRAAQRLGYDHENGLVKQVLYRLNLAEKLKAPWRRGKRPDPSQAAAREASRLELEEGANAPLGFTVKMMLIGLTGAGKTQLIHSLLSSGGIGPHAPPPPSSSPTTTAAGAAGAAPHPQGQACDGRPKLVDPFEGQTKKVQVLEGTVHGLRVVCVDTPGLVASASAAGYNGKVLQQIRSAYRRHKPDLVIYVDRLDATASTGGELPALRVLSESLGAGLWLNTIVALTHAGSPPPNGPKGPMSFDAYANQRSHLLQQVIRSASGDNRLMNPTAFVDSHPNCELNAAGQAVIANGMPWKAHLYLMIVSAKLLADTEGMLQMQDGSSPAGAGAAAAANAAAMQQMMMGGAAPTRQLPLPYLMSSLTQFSRPVKYPDHDLVIDTRLMEKAVGTAPDGKQARGLVRQVKARLLQLRQAHANKERMQRSFRNATLAGGKVTPEPPRLATKRAPSVHPPATFRYRVPEPSDGWVVRPHIEHHGMDHSDGIEGLYLEKMAVAGRNLQDRAEDAPSTSSGSVGGDGSAGVRKKRGKGRSDVDLLLGGVPYRHYVSAQCNKEHKAVQVRSEATLYHDPLGKSTSTLSADIQSSGGAGGMPMDALCTLRADLRRRGILGEQGKATLGLLATRIAEGCRPHRGPMAVGGRLQQTMTPPFPGSSHCKLSAAAAYLTTLPGSGVADAMLPDREGCLGGNLELIADMQPLAGTRDPLSLTLSTNAIRYRGEVMTGIAAALQCQASRSEMWGGRVQVGNKGKAALSIKVKSTEHWWAGVAAMVMPLGTLLLQSVGLMR